MAYTNRLVLTWQIVNAALVLGGQDRDGEVEAADLSPRPLATFFERFALKTALARPSTPV